MKRFNLLTGLVISILVMLLNVALRSSREEMNFSMLMFIRPFVNAFLSWLLVQWIIQQNFPRSYIWKAIIAMLSCAAVSLLVFYSIADVTAVRDRIAFFPRGMHIVHFLLLLRGMIIGGLLYFIAYLVQVTALNQQAKLENEKLKKENLQARLSQLQEQISPHFLFNSLGTLRSMVSEPAPRKFIQQLADFYRYLLNSQLADLMQLRAELDFARAYLHILQERFEDALIVNIDIPEKYLSMKLPPLTLQQLIENAVKHNTLSSEAPLEIYIQCTDADRLVVRNSLRPKGLGGENSGTGLKNINERYLLLLNRKIEVLQTKEEFIVSVFLINILP